MASDSSLRVGYERFHPDTNINYQLNRLASDGSPQLLGDVKRSAERIRTLGDWVQIMLELGDQAHAAGRQGDEARFVRAAEFFMSPDDSRRRATYERYLSLIDLIYANEFERHGVPFEGNILPAYVVAGTAADETVVIHGGFDSFIEEFFPFLIALRDRRVRVIAFEGPGQGGALLRSGLHMTHEWERPVHAVLDHFAIEDCTLVGVSLGGYLALRAAAFEARVSRVVAYDVLYDFFDCVVSRRGNALVPTIRWLLDRRADALIDRVFRAVMRHDRLAEWGVNQGMHVTGEQTPSAFLRAIREYSTESISSRIRQDVLLLAGEKDHFVPLRQLEQQRHALVNARSVTERVFRESESAGSHCQIGNLPLVVNVITEWIEKTRRSRQPGRIQASKAQVA